MQGRVWFEGSPWPEGHAVTRFNWEWFEDDRGHRRIEIELETAPFDAEGPGKKKAKVGTPAAWMAGQRATLRTEAGIKAADGVEEDNFELTAKDAKRSPGDRAFSLDLAGSDAIADHTLAFEPDGDTWNLVWTARYGLAGAPEHPFRAELKGVLDPAAREKQRRAASDFPSMLLPYVEEGDLAGFYKALDKDRATPEVIDAVLALPTDAMKRFVRMLGSKRQMPRDPALLDRIEDPAARKWLAEHLKIKG